MQFVSSYKIFKEKGFIIEYHEGIGNLDNVISFKLKESEDRNYSPNFDLLMDIRHTTIKGVKSDVKKYIEFANRHKGISGKRKLAVITSKPRHVVFFTFLNMFPSRLPQTMKLFSSIEAAMFWLGGPLELDEVKCCLDNLKEKARTYLTESLD